MTKSDSDVGMMLTLHDGDDSTHEQPLHEKSKIHVRVTSDRADDADCRRYIIDRILQVFLYGLHYLVTCTYSLMLSAHTLLTHSRLTGS